MLETLDSDSGFLKRVCFSNESTFHVSGLLNKYKLKIWGLENPHDTCELERDSSKLNVWCGIMHNKIIDPFFFAEKSTKAQIYLDVLTEYVLFKLEQYQLQVIFQQKGATPHWSLEVFPFLNETFLDRWIGRDGPIQCPPRSPDITPLDFFLWATNSEILFVLSVHVLSLYSNVLNDALRAVTQCLRPFPTHHLTVFPNIQPSEL